MPLKRVVKVARNAAISALRPHRWQHTDGSLLILTYHRVLPADFDELDIVEPGMFVFDETFDMHLRTLSREFDMVGLGDWLAARATGDPLPKRACAVTFDDGWRDNFDHAFPILAAHGVPATIFVVAGKAGSDSSFWPERLARFLRSGAADHLPVDSPARTWLEGLYPASGVARTAVGPEEISRLIHAAKQWDDETNCAHLDVLEDAAGGSRKPARDLLNWHELRTMAGSGLVALGSHTINHTRLLDGLDSQTMRAEIVDSRAMLERETGARVSLFCYPNGDMTSAAEAIVRDNYAGACTTRVAWNRPDADPHRLARITIHQGNSASRAALLARASAWI